MSNQNQARRPSTEAQSNGDPTVDPVTKLALQANGRDHRHDRLRLSAHRNFRDPIGSTPWVEVRRERELHPKRGQVSFWRVLWREPDGYLRHRDHQHENLAKDFARLVECRLNLDLLEAEVQRITDRLGDAA